jgi:hypothetical protein
MLYFKQDVRKQSGKTYRAGQPVPDGFTTPLGLIEMIASGDIEDRQDEQPAAEVEKPVKKGKAK